MALPKIHLHLFSIHGADGNLVKSDAAEAIDKALRSIGMLDLSPDQHTITGLQRLEDVIGGFFAVEYLRDVLTIDENKNEHHSQRPEFEKTLFALFPHFGHVLIQSRTYPKGLTKDRVEGLFLRVLRDTLMQAGIGQTLIGAFKQPEVKDEKFVEIFVDSNNRIKRIEVEDINPLPIVGEITYYNPQRERNEILGQAFIDDFRLYDKIMIDAGDKGTDISQGKFAKAAVRAGHNQKIVYVTNNKEHVLQRNIRTTYEVSVDIDSEVVRVEDLEKIAYQLYEQYGEEGPTAPPNPQNEQSSFNLGDHYGTLGD